MKGFLLLFLCAFTWSKRNKNEEYLALKMSELAYEGFSNAKDPFEELPESLENAKKAFAIRELLFKSEPSAKKDSVKAIWGINATVLDEKPQIYLAFKGTSTAKELKLDIWNSEASSNKDLEILIHDGMNKLLSSSHQLTPIIDGLFKSWREMTDAQLIITGHSLGGGLAQIFGAYLKDEKFRNKLFGQPEMSEFLAFLAKSKIYTFGAPQVFRENHKFGTPNWVEELGKSSFHFVNQRDPVPLLNIMKERSFVEVLKNGFNAIRRRKTESACSIWQTLRDSYRHYGTIYYLSRSQPLKIMDLKQLKKKAGSALIRSLLKPPGWILLTVKQHFLKSYNENYVRQERRSAATPKMGPRSRSVHQERLNST